MSEHGRQGDGDPTPRRPARRAVRTLAMQLLYEIDLTGKTERAALVEELADRDPAPADAATAEAAVDLALGAWHSREQADAWLSALAPGWPTHRQPPVDRALLRLACHEMRTDHAPPRVAINEAVELAKRFASEQSPAFINGVLDQLAKQLERDQELPIAPSPEADTPAPPDPDDWLDDALDKDE